MTYYGSRLQKLAPATTAYSSHRAQSKGLHNFKMLESYQNQLAVTSSRNAWKVSHTQLPALSKLTSANLAVMV